MAMGFPLGVQYMGLTPNHWSVCRTSLHLSSRSDLSLVSTRRCSRRWTRAPLCNPPPCKWRTPERRLQTPLSPRKQTHSIRLTQRAGTATRSSLCLILLFLLTQMPFPLPKQNSVTKMMIWTWSLWLLSNLRYSMILIYLSFYLLT